MLWRGMTAVSCGSTIVWHAFIAARTPCVAWRDVCARPCLACACNALSCGARLRSIALQAGRSHGTVVDRVLFGGPGKPEDVLEV